MGPSRSEGRQMSDFQVSAVHAPPPAAPVRAIAPPQPPKAQSDHKPANPATSSRGPAVVLSGALAKAPERHGDSAPETGQHINRVV
jgi:hypothetical protein